MSCYPKSIRGTVHPKPKQWGIHLVNRHTRIFPWHGVAYKNESEIWKIKYEFDARRMKARPVHIKGDLYPFYYEAIEHCKSSS